MRTFLALAVLLAVAAATSCKVWSTFNRINGTETQAVANTEAGWVNLNLVASLGGSSVNASATSEDCQAGVTQCVTTCSSYDGGNIIGYSQCAMPNQDVDKCDDGANFKSISGAASAKTICYKACTGDNCNTAPWTMCNGAGAVAPAVMLLAVLVAALLL